jgi:hypothetical protein
VRADGAVLAALAWLEPFKVSVIVMDGPPGQHLLKPVAGVSNGLVAVLGDEGLLERLFPAAAGVLSFDDEVDTRLQLCC